MNLKQFLITLPLSLLLSVWLLLGSPITAQTPGGTWSVQTATEAGPDNRGRFEISAEPGDVLTEHISVKNLGASPVRLSIYASDATAAADGSFDLLPADTVPTGVGTWVRLQQEAIALQGGESALLPFTLTVPANATPGDHIGGIVAVLSQSGTTNDNNQVRVDYRVGVRLYVRVSGELSPALSVESVLLSYSGTMHPFSGGDATVSYTVSNPGNVILDAEQRLRLSGPLGVTVKDLQLPDLPQILPGHSYSSSAQAEGVIPVGPLRAELVLTPRFVDASSVPSLGQVSGSSATRWALPWPQFVLLLLLTSLLLLAIQLLQRRRRQAALDRAFSADALVGLVEQINARRSQELLDIARATAAQPSATSAAVSGLSRVALDLMVVVDGRAELVRLPWPRQLDHPSEVELEILQLAHAETPATAASGGRQR